MSSLVFPSSSNVPALLLNQLGIKRVSSEAMREMVPEITFFFAPFSSWLCLAQDFQCYHLQVSRDEQLGAPFKSKRKEMVV